MMFRVISFFVLIFVLSMGACSPSNKKKLGESCVNADECMSGKCAQNNGQYVCTSINANQNCVVGATQACVCTSGKNGSQTCNADGKSWGTCQCSSNNNVCTPNAAQACVCTSGKNGTQKCNQNGTGWEICVCNNGQLICTAGSTQACVCTTGKNGTRICNADGKSWGSCQCGSGGKKGLGEGPCAQPSECQTNLCMVLSDRSYCTQSCTGKCPQGYACALYNNKQVCGKIRAGAKPFGSSCTASFDCESILCLQGGICSQRCDFTPCPSGYSCIEVGTNFKVCTANQGKGLCSQTEVANLGNCIGKCQNNQTCEVGCYAKNLNKKCEQCYMELAKCGSQSNCTPVKEPSCCQTKRIECFGN